MQLFVYVVLLFERLTGTIIPHPRHPCPVCPGMIIRKRHPAKIPLPVFRTMDPGSVFCLRINTIRMNDKVLIIQKKELAAAVDFG
jgi:hypothetical protein